MTTFKDLQHGTVNPFQPNTRAVSYLIDKTLEQGVHRIDLITSGTYTLGLWLDDIYVGMFCDNSLTFELANDVYVEDVIIKEYNDLGEIEYVKLVSGSNVTEWTPAPEDFNNLKGKSYALSQPLRNANILSLNGSFEEDDFIGLWLGDDKFVGFLDNQELTFDLTENYDDEFVIVKTLSEKGVIDNAKLEKGNVAHRWTPAPEDKSIPKFRFFEYVKIISKPHEIDDSMLIKKQTIHLDDPSQNTIEVGVEVSSFTDKQLEANNTIKNINADYVKNEAITDVRNNITSLSSEIQQTAEQIRTEVSEEYVSNGYMDEFRSEVSTQFTQTATDYTYLFTQLETYVQTLDGDTQTQFNEIVKYIRFIDGKIVLGEINNPLILEIQNNRISFKQNGAEVAYISDNTLYITDGRFLNSLRIGEFMFKPRSNGSLSFGKAGD